MDCCYSVDYWHQKVIKGRTKQLSVRDLRMDKHFKKVPMSDLPHCAEHLREFLVSFEANIVERKDNRIQGELHVVTGDIIESGSMLDSSHKSDESEGGMYVLLLLWLGCSSDMS